MGTYWQQYQDLKTNQPHFYARDAAKQFGISECELVASNPDSTILSTQPSDIKDIVLSLKELGKVECLVRNELVVHEKLGIYENVSMTPSTGIALNIGGLDLRIFSKKWHYTLALKDTSKTDVVYSIQFFDEYGTAIQKVFVRDASKIEAWQKLVNTFTKADAQISITEKPPKKQHINKQLDEKQLVAFQERWLELKDVHHFVGLLEIFDIDRITAYEHAPKDMAFKVKPDTFSQAFNLAHDVAIDIMLFVGNRGIVQIQTGKIHHIKPIHGWLNLMDKAEEDFTLHLKENELEQVWVVRRPTRDGIITCIEGFSADGQTALIMFGKRTEGDPEQPAWQDICQQVIDASV